jgi:hypothetical protein
MNIYYTSPGITDSADITWYQQILNINNYCGIFTVGGIIFPNASQLTIANLLSDNYTYGYINRRFIVNGTSFLKDVMSYLVAFNNLQLVAEPTNNTLANSFAAALWAIDFIMEWVIVGGFRVDFYNPIKNVSLQSVLGQAPIFSPSPLYSGLLFTLIANEGEPYIIRPRIVPGTSENIKVYGL